MLRSSRMMLCEEQLGLATHREAQVVVEPGEPLLVGRRRLQRADLQPLPAELLDQRAGLVVLQHAPHLALEHHGLPQLAPVGEPPQLRVGHARPEEIRQARRELVVADGRSRRRRRSTRLDVRRGCRRWVQSAMRCAAAGPARCGTGNPARPASPGWRRRALPRAVRRGVGRAPPGRRTWPPPPASRVAGTRGVPCRRRSGGGTRERGRRCDGRRRRCARGSRRAGAVACAYGPPISIAATRASFAGTRSACCSSNCLRSRSSFSGEASAGGENTAGGCRPRARGSDRRRTPAALRTAAARMRPPNARPQAPGPACRRTCRRGPACG